MTSSTRFTGKVVAIVSATICVIVLIGFAPALACVSKSEGPSDVGNFSSSRKRDYTPHRVSGNENQDGSVGGEVIFRDDPAVNVEKSTEKSA